MDNQSPQATQQDLNNIGLPLRPQIENDKRIYSMSESTNANTQPEGNETKQPKSKQNDDGGNDKKPENVKRNKYTLRRIPQFYGFFIRRVVNTARLYLDSPYEKQAIVDENSRFYYVKPILDNLKMQKKKSLREYLDNIKKQVYHKLITEEELAEMKSKGIPRRTDKPILSKKFVEEFITSKHSDVLIKLNEEFLKPGNPDFELYMNNEMDEVQIGKVVRTNKTFRKKTWETMQKDMPHYKSMYAVLVKAVKVKQEILSSKPHKGENTEENTEKDSQA